jgi:hypothetical protein
VAGALAVVVQAAWDLTGVVLPKDTGLGLEKFIQQWMHHHCSIQPCRLALTRDIFNLWFFLALLVPDSL